MLIKTKRLAYHCTRCGGVTSPANEKCEWCGMPNAFRTKVKDPMFRVFAELEDGQRFYFHEVTKVETMKNSVERIDATMLDDSVSRYISTRDDSGTISLNALYTDNALKKIQYIKDNGKFALSFETPTMGTAFRCKFNEIEIFPPQITQNGMLDLDIKCQVEEYIGISNVEDELTVDNGSICPNCGAKLRRLFGLCDYCGGWSQYKDYFI